MTDKQYITAMAVSISLRLILCLFAGYFSSALCYPSYYGALALSITTSTIISIVFYNIDNILGEKEDVKT